MPCSAVFLNLFTYVTQTTSGKNCVAQYLVSIGCAFIRVNNTQYSEVANFVSVCNSVIILPLNEISVLPRCGD